MLGTGWPRDSSSSYPGFGFACQFANGKGGPSDFLSTKYFLCNHGQSRPPDKKNNSDNRDKINQQDCIQSSASRRTSPGVFHKSWCTRSW